ncbi:UNVERIFIED_CONTAM: hypothetical protein H355_004914 [Colinus virginianus]|nr:hypothetical protein H355_004914 [Colinus virginianus]
MSQLPSSFTSREDARKAKELEEARKAGTAEPEKDEEGNAINPHIPQYISKAPWYLNQQKPGLKHQRFKPAEKEDISLWYDRGRKKRERAAGGVSAQKVKFEKGSCANCGARTHQAKDCTERPRSRKAKYTQENLCEDEEIFDDLKLSYDGKRDRYAGYDPADYKWVIREYELAEIERKRRKAQELQTHIRSLKKKAAAAAADGKMKKKKSKSKERGAAEGEGNAGGDAAKESKKKNNTTKGKDQGGEKVDGEKGSGNDTDTADEEKKKEGEGDTDSGSDSGATSETDTDSDSEDSSDEDVKQHAFDQTSAPVACSDDRYRINTRNLRIREDTAKYLLNLDVNSAFYDPKSRSMRENPFQNMKGDEQSLFKGDNYARSTGDVVKAQQLQVFAWEAYKHGAQVHFNAQPTQLEKLYQEHIDKKKGRDRLLVKSKYEEDVFVGNHTSVFGSWYNIATHRWGFACCKQTDFGADCTVYGFPSMCKHVCVRYVHAIGVEVAAELAHAKIKYSTREYKYSVHATSMRLLLEIRVVILSSVADSDTFADEEECKTGLND